MRREIDLIVLHCSATRPSSDVDADRIRRWHMRDNNWRTLATTGSSGALANWRRAATRPNPGRMCAVIMPTALVSAWSAASTKTGYRTATLRWSSGTRSARSCTTCWAVTQVPRLSATTTSMQAKPARVLMQRFCSMSDMPHPDPSRLTAQLCSKVTNSQPAHGGRTKCSAEVSNKMTTRIYAGW